MYKPEGYKNPYPYNPEPTPTLPNTAYNAYEAGADAMLEGLMTGVRYRVVAEYVDGKELTIDSKNGYLVFIPEEE